MNDHTTTDRRLDDLHRELRRVRVRRRRRRVVALSALPVATVAMALVLLVPATPPVPAPPAGPSPGPTRSVEKQSRQEPTLTLIARSERAEPGPRITISGGTTAPNVQRLTDDELLTALNERGTPAGIYRTPTDTRLTDPSIATRVGKPTDLRGRVLDAIGAAVLALHE